MKFFKKISSVLLSLVLCGSMVAPAFAASFKDLNNAINDDFNSEYTNHSSGSSNGEYYYGSQNAETGVWDIVARDNGDTRDVTVNTNIAYDADNDMYDSNIYVGNGKDVNLNLDDHTITGAKDTSVIQIAGTYTDPDAQYSSAPDAGSLTINGGTIVNDSESSQTDASSDDRNCVIHVGADAKLTLNNTTVTGSKDGIYAEAGAEIHLDEDAEVTGTTGADVILNYGTVLRPSSNPSDGKLNEVFHEGASINTPDGGSWTDPTGKSYSGDVISSGEDLSLTWVPAGTTDPTDPDPTEPTAPGESGDTPNEAEIADPDVPMSQGPVSCAEFIHKMWVLDGEPEPLDDLGLPEGLDEDHEYASAIAWAASAGIVSRDSFDAEALLTVALAREFLTGYAAYADMAMPELTTLTGKDSDLVMNSDDVLDEFFGGKDSE